MSTPFTPFSEAEIGAIHAGAFGTPGETPPSTADQTAPSSEPADSQPSGEEQAAAGSSDEGSEQQTEETSSGQTQQQASEEVQPTAVDWSKADASYRTEYETIKTGHDRLSTLERQALDLIGKDKDGRERPFLLEPSLEIGTTYLASEKFDPEILSNKLFQADPERFGTYGAHLTANIFKRNPDPYLGTLFGTKPDGSPVTARDAFNGLQLLYAKLANPDVNLDDVEIDVPRPAPANQPAQVTLPPEIQAKIDRFDSLEQRVSAYEQGRIAHETSQLMERVSEPGGRIAEEAGFKVLPGDSKEVVEYKSWAAGRVHEAGQNAVLKHPVAQEIEKSYLQKGVPVPKHKIDIGKAIYEEAALKEAKQLAFKAAQDRKQIDSKLKKDKPKVIPSAHQGNAAPGQPQKDAGRFGSAAFSDMSAIIAETQAAMR